MRPGAISAPESARRPRSPKHLKSLPRSARDGADSTGRQATLARDTEEQFGQAAYNRKCKLFS